MVSHGTDEDDILPAQIRAARALLGWSQIEAAERFGIGRATLARIERSESAPRDGTVEGMLQVLRSNGIVLSQFPHGYGVSFDARLIGSPSD